MRVIKIGIIQYLFDCYPLFWIKGENLFKESDGQGVGDSSLLQILPHLVWAVWTLNLQKLLMFLNPRPNFFSWFAQLIKNGNKMLFSLCILILPRYSMAPGLKPKNEIASEHILKNTSKGPDVNPVGVRHIQEQFWGLKPRCANVALPLQFYKLI